MSRPSSNSTLLSYLLILTTLFFLLEISFFIQCSDIYLGDFHYISNHIKFPTTILPGILFYLTVLIAAHLFFTLMVWACARLLSLVLKLNGRTMVNLGLVLWFLALFSILLANQYFFPNSKFSGLTNVLFPQNTVGYVLILLAILGIGILLILFMGFVRYIYWQPKKFLGVLIVFALTGVLLSLNFKTSMVSDAATLQKPNIILIGIDALRPDFVGYFGAEKTTPHLDQFLNQATVFTESLTPLGRTFPAWISILTGRYPKLNGIRTDLSDQTALDVRTTLSYILQHQGYQTLYATDETRFSNIDRTLGFDKLISPPMGLNDFLIGTLNDFPLTNLLVNTRLGQWLFPYNYANRSVFITYEPNTFLKLIQSNSNTDRNKPVFLAVHFCLTHLPYFWASEIPDDKLLPNYQAAIHRVDKQFYDFLQILQQAKLLDHAIVVVLSDHGDGFELPGDRMTDPDLFVAGKNNPRKIIPQFYPPSLDNEKVNEATGHGVDALGLTQNHTLLAFRLYGLQKNQKNSIPGRVSLLDIKPTLLNYLNIPLTNENGHSLLEILLGKKSAANFMDDFFLETDYSPPALHSVHPEVKKILLEGIDYYQIDPITTRVTVKKNMVDMIIASKQYADFYGPWVLALYPQNKTWRMPILVNMETGEWTNDLDTDFAKHSPAQHMLQALKSFYF